MLFVDVGIYLIFLMVSTTPATSLTPGMPRTKSKPVSKLALLDRDGVINKDVGAPGVLDPSRLELTSGAGVALGKLRRKGYTIALITNQSCVGKGLITEEDLRGIHERLQEMLLEQDRDAIFDEIFYCTSLKEDNDHRMKPNPGMIAEAMEIFGGDASDPVSAFESVFFVGDTLTDLQAAASARIPTRILVETGYGRGIMRGEEAPHVYGTVKVVNENESNIEMTSITDNSKRAGGVSKPSIFPFVYTKTFSSAVEWIINTKQMS